MNALNRIAGWKIYLGIAGMIIVLASLLYSNYLAGEFVEREQKMASHWLEATTALAESDDEDDLYCDLSLHQKIIESNSTIPVILTDHNNNALIGRNFGAVLDEDTEFLQKQVNRLIEMGVEPLKSPYNFLYFKESKIVTQFRYFPYVQFLLIASFVLFGYFGINAARKAEQNRVWVGLAKETAHQLGTPISAIVAWIEHLRLMKEEDVEVNEILNELQNDVDRLELIANRFSKIGSVPKLESVNIVEELEKCKDYMQKRASRRVEFHFPKREEQKLQADINPPLFDWVIENLLRNALDAMSSKGKISADVMDDPNYVYIDISDTGKGIPNNNFAKVFEPGFTTKKRGWGLGLSLAKRIIEEYHSGKIFVKKSKEGVGSTFTIQLPKKK